MHVSFDQLPHCHTHNKQTIRDTSTSIPSKYIYYLWYIPNYDNWQWEGIQERFIHENSRLIGDKIIFSPYHSQFNGVLGKFHSFLKRCIKKHIHGTLDTEDTVQLSFSDFQILLDIHSKESPFFLHFCRDPLTPLWKLLSPKIRYWGDKRCLLDLEVVRYALALARKNTCLSRQRSDKDHTPTRSPDQFKVGDLVYIKNHATSAWEPKLEIGFCLIKFSTSQCYSGECSKWKNQNSRYRGHMFSKPITVIETEDFPPNRWGRKSKLLFSEESLLDINWQNC